LRIRFDSMSIEPPPQYSIAIPSKEYCSLKKRIHLLIVGVVIGQLTIMSLSILHLIFGINGRDLLLVYFNTFSIFFVLSSFILMSLGGSMRKECVIINICGFLYYVIYHFVIFILYLYYEMYIDGICQLIYVFLGFILLGVSWIILNNIKQLGQSKQQVI
jgi:hypothetical protein